MALPPLVPPLRFSQVEEGVYRGAYPSLINQRFLTRLGLRTIISLLPEPPADDLRQWCEPLLRRVLRHFVPPRAGHAFRPPARCPCQRRRALCTYAPPGPCSASEISLRVVHPRCEQHGVDNHAVVVLPFKKDEVTLTHECAAELLQLLATPERLPVYVHCLDGVTATGEG